MKVLFAIPPHANYDSDIRPKLGFSINRTPYVGTLGLASYLRSKGHNVHVLDGNRVAWRNGNIRSLTNWELQWQAKRFNPDMVAFTVLTGDFYECASLAKILREVLPKALFVAGGPHPSGEPEAALKQIPELDGVGLGPGEETCLELAECVPLSSVDGCAYLDGDSVVYTGLRKVGRIIDCFPYPAFDLIDTAYYCEPSLNSVFGLLTRSLPVLTGRGCPNLCYFCSSKGKGSLRVHSIQYVVDYCRWLVDRYPVDTIAFWDDVLGTSKKRLRKLCEGFVESGLSERVGWSAQMRADKICDPSLLELMGESGCVKVSFGAESGSQNTLETLNKGITVSQNYRAALALEESGMPHSISLMLGVPGESEADMRQTFNFIKDFPSAHYGVGRFCPLPGSPAYRDLVGSGLVDPYHVDWSRLGNFTLVDGPYFGAAPHYIFKHLLTKIKSHIQRGNRLFFLRHNRDPAIRKLYEESLVSRFLRHVVPDRLKGSAKKLLLGVDRC